MIPPSLINHFQAYLTSRTGIFKQVRKRDGRVVAFAPSRIQRAIARAGQATGEFDDEVALRLAIKTINLADQVLDTELPSVEQVQDIVEEVLLASPFRKTARAYMRQPQLVADHTPVDHVLPRMRVTRQPMVLVVDERMEVIGLVTLADVLDEILGT